MGESIKDKEGTFGLNKLIRWAVRPLVQYLIENTSVTANNMTALSIIFGLAAMPFLVFGHLWSYIIFFILMMLFKVADSMDGTIARTRGTVGYIGEFSETFKHIVMELFICIGLTVGVYNSTGNITVLWVGSLMTLLDILTKYAHYANYRGIIISQDKTTFSSDSVFGLFPRYSKGWKYKLNRMIFTNYYVALWILIGALLDSFIHLGITFLSAYIFLMFIARLAKFVLSIAYFIKKPM